MAKKVSGLVVEPLTEENLKRLSELDTLAKEARKGGLKLTIDQRHEHRKLKALRAVVEAADALGKLQEEEQKAADRRKYQLGELIMKAGLETWPEPQLLGGLLALAKTEPKHWPGFITSAEAFKQAQAPKAVHLLVRFPEAPGEDVQVALKKRGFAYSEAKGFWEGAGVLTEIEAELAPSKGMIEVVDPPLPNNRSMPVAAAS